MIKRIFDERAHMYNIIKNNSKYITDGEINSILDEHKYCDLTFKFIPTASGFRTLIIDNSTETEESVTLDDLNCVAMDYYLSEVAAISKERTQRSIGTIRELLYA